MVYSNSVIDLVLYCVVLYCIVLYCIVLCYIVLCCVILYCIVLNCIVLYCIVLGCLLLYHSCIVLHIPLDNQIHTLSCFINLQLYSRRLGRRTCKPLWITSSMETYHIIPKYVTIHEYNDTTPLAKCYFKQTGVFNNRVITCGMVREASKTLKVENE